MWCRRVECTRALGRQQQTTDLRQTQVLTKTRKGCLNYIEGTFVMECRRRVEAVQTGTEEPCHGERSIDDDSQFKLDSLRWKLASVSVMWSDRRMLRSCRKTAKHLASGRQPDACIYAVSQPSQECWNAKAKYFNPLLIYMDPINTKEMAKLKAQLQ